MRITWVDVGVELLVFAVALSDRCAVQLAKTKVKLKVAANNTNKLIVK